MKSIHELARDGTRITNAIIAMGGYQSISGNYIRIDKNGDSEGNFTAFALKKSNFTYMSLISSKKFECNYYLQKVGDFRLSHLTQVNGSNGTVADDKMKELPEYISSDAIDWPNNHRPLDEPICGYNGFKCQGSQGRTEIAAGILG